MSLFNYIVWNPSPEIFSIGSFSIRWYGLLFAMGFFVAYMVLYHIFNREKIPIKMLDRLTVYVFIATVVGARLGHVFFYDWDYYRDHLGEIFLVWEGGLASHGAGIAIILALIIYIRQYKVNMWWLFDRVAVVIPMVAAFVRLGNLMNSEIYGVPTRLSWGFIFHRGGETLADGTVLNFVPCHPTQLYEAVSYILISVVLYVLWRKNITNIKPGLSVGIFLVGMFTARFLIEFLKIPQEKFNNTTLLDMGQWLSIPFVLLGTFFIIYSFKTKK
jgi:phosphatidylglycerol---prolipoprotein diacylglyceryl transferase